MTGELLDLLLGRLAQASLAAAVGVGIVWLALRAWPRIPGDLRVALWWLVAAKTLLVLFWPAPIPLPVLPPAAGEAPVPVVVASPLPERAVSREAVDGTGPGRATATAPGETSLELAKSALLALWLLPAAALVLRDVLRTRRVRREAATAASPTNARANALFQELRCRVGAGSARLKTGDETRGPFVVGPWRPVVVLPPSFERLPEAELRLVLAHELLHVRRNDLWLGLVPALAERLFFFHPLVLFAGREYRLAREAACDAAVLHRLDPPPRDYGRLLLALGAAARPVTAGVGASSNRGQLKRRLEMLEHPNRPLRRGSILWLLPLALILLAPVDLVARDADEQPPETDTATEWVLLEEADEEAIEEREAAERARQSEEAARREAEVEEERAERSREHEELARERAELARERDENRVRAQREPREGLSFVFLSGDHSTMHGSSREIDEARRLRRGEEDLLFVAREDGAWVIRDRETLRAADRILEPQRRLGRQQAELGAQQAELGSRQAELGSRQAGFGRQQAELGAKQAALAAELQHHVAREMELTARELRIDSRGEEAEAARRAIERERRELEEDRRTVEDRMRSLSGEMSRYGGDQGELGARQAALGREQAALGALQAELGERQREASELAHREMEELVERAIAAGVAERVDD